MTENSRGRGCQTQPSAPARDDGDLALEAEEGGEVLDLDVFHFPANMRGVSLLHGGVGGLVPAR